MESILPNVFLVRMGGYINESVIYIFIYMYVCRRYTSRCMYCIRGGKLYNKRARTCSVDLLSFVTTTPNRRVHEISIK